MQIPILVEPLPDGKGYRARAGEPLAMTAEAPTAEEALRQLQEAVEARLRSGARLLSIRVGGSGPTLPPPGGYLPDDELTREWREIMAENRRKKDEEPDFPWEASGLPTAGEKSPRLQMNFWPDDAFTRAWLEGIAEYRRQKEQEPEPWERDVESDTPQGGPNGETSTSDEPGRAGP